MRLTAAIKYDVMLQVRHGFYLVYGIVTLLYIIALRSIPSSAVETAAVVVIFTDPSILGFLFIGGIMLLERGQRTLEGIFVTPLRISEYLISKVLSLSLIGLASSLIIAVGSIGISFNFALAVPAVLVTSIVFTLLGFTASVRAESINHYFILMIPYYIVMMLPLLDYFGAVQSDLFYIIPSRGSLMLLEGAFNGIGLMDILLSFGSLVLWSVIAWLWASKWFYKYVVLRSGRLK